MVKDLQEKGVCVVETEEELKNCRDGTVVIRSHGVGKRIYDLLNGEQIPYVDATCPFVRKIHRIVEKYSSQDCHHHFFIVNDRTEGINLPFLLPRLHVNSIHRTLNAKNATCPFVRKIHRIVEKYSSQDCHVVIIGNENHPEVEGIKGWSGNVSTARLTPKQKPALFARITSI